MEKIVVRVVNSSAPHISLKMEKIVVRVVNSTAPHISLKIVNFAIKNFVSPIFKSALVDNSIVKKILDTILSK